MRTHPLRPKRDPKPYQRKDTGYWFIRFYHRGRHPKRKLMPTGIKSELGAPVPSSVQDLLTDWGRMWRDGSFDPWREKPPRKMQLHDAIDNFITARERSGLRPDTIKGLRLTLEPFARGLTPGLLVEQVGAAHIDRYVHRKDISAMSREVYFNRLRTFFRWCVVQGYRFDDPTDLAQKPVRAVTTRDILLPEELDRVLRATAVGTETNPEQKILEYVFTFAAATGLRLGELCSRQWKHVNLELGTLEICDTFDAKGQPVFTLKTRESRRMVPLFPRAHQVLTELYKPEMKPEDPVFQAPRGGFVIGPWVSRRWRKYRKIARIEKNVPFHGLRHTFITYVLALGIPETKVMKMAGHTKYDTIKNYLHIVDDLLQEAPHEALARYLPGYTGRKPVMAKKIAAWLAGEMAPTPTKESSGRVSALRNEANWKPKNVLEVD